MLLVKKSMFYVFIIAIVSFITMKVFNFQTGIIETYNYNGIIQYRLHLSEYLKNISKFDYNINIGVETILPSRAWEDPGSNWLTDDFWNALFNNMAYIIDWIYMPLNIVLYPIRIGFYVLRLLLAIVGWPTSYTIINGDVVYDSKIMQFLVWCINNIIIPYI